MIAEALGESRASVAAYLITMFRFRAVNRNKTRPFVYTLSDLSPADALPNLVAVSLRKETKLADEQRVLTALSEERVSDREMLLELLGWTPHRLGQTLDRLHSASLVKTVRGSYVLMPRNP